MTWWQMASPTSRTLKYYRDRGYEVDIVERYIYHAKRRKDLFGWIDILAVHPSGDIIGVQTTSSSNVSARVKKAKGKRELLSCLRAGMRLVVQGWRKGVRGVDGLREVEICQDDVLPIDDQEVNTKE